MPMSDHADFDELLAHVECRRAATRLHAPRLRAGLRADPVRTRRRRAGALRGASERPATRPARAERMTPYRALAEALEGVASSRGKLAKIARLADALAALEEPRSSPSAARLLSGSPFAEWEAGRDVRRLGHARAGGRRGDGLGPGHDRRLRAGDRRPRRGHRAAAPARDRPNGLVRSRTWTRSSASLSARARPPRSGALLEELLRRVVAPSRRSTC